MSNVQLFNLDFGSLVKQWKKGHVDKVYDRMYSKAMDLAVFESQKFSESVIKIKQGETPQEAMDEYFQKIFDYQKERVDHHMREMKELLLAHLSEKK